MKNVLVLLDNGHGKETPGKCSPDNLIQEWKYTRMLARAISQELASLKIESILIAPEENDVSLKERCKRVNNICKGTHFSKVILISLHCNASGCDGKWHSARGWSAYTSKGVTESDIIAKFLYKAAEEYFSEDVKIRKYNGDKEPDFESDFYILKHTKCPAVLTENFFQDSKEDTDFMLTSEGTQQIIQCHVNGIKNYVESLGKS